MSSLMMNEAIRRFSESIPNKVAIEFGEEKITYKNLEDITNAIADFFIEHYEKEKNVVVLMENSPELIETVIGIIKSGGIFVPIDYAAPDNRIMTIVNEVKAEWIVTTPKLLEKVIQLAETFDNEVNCLIIESGGKVRHTNDIKEKVFFIEDYKQNLSKNYEYCTNKHCYLYFTSGSTGNPKGVLGRYRSLMQFIEWEINEMEGNQSCKVSQLTPVSFDPFLRDILFPLCSGGTLCIPESPNLILSSYKLLNWLEHKAITHIHMVPSLFKLMASGIETKENLNYLKYILLAGELLRGNDIKKFFLNFGERIQLVNLYGPTETTLAKLFHKVKAEDIEKAIVPVGKPIDFAEVYILDNNLEICNVGVQGEIYIRTPFISSGYVNDKELTKKSFLRNPFTHNPNDIIYKTGDFGRQLIDGSFEVIGRVDNQVKIRGMRIELGEVENNLLQLEYVKEAIILDKVDEFGTKYLYAYLVVSKELSLEEIKSDLSKYLPEYMIPAYFIQVDKMPLNANGKIDKKKLLSFEHTLDSQLDYIEPSNDIERRLVDIWSKILNRTNISINSSFFDLGGHSLKAANLISEIYKHFNVDMSFSDVFKEPTIIKMADFISKAEKLDYEEITKTEDREYYQASSAQKRMYILQQLDLQGIEYNMPRMLRIKGKLSKIKIEEVFHKLVQRHETLRTSFESKDGEIVQRVNKIENFNIEYITKADKSMNQLITEFVVPFDLSKAPLLKVVLAELVQDEYLLMFDMHHIISDGISMSILIHEFISLYEEKDMEQLKIQYKDYSQWQYQLLSSDKMKKQEEYWINIFSDEVPILNMPLDYKRPAVQSFEGSKFNFNLDKDVTRSIAKMAKETGSTVYIILLSCIYILLSKLSGQEDIIIGSPISGRSHPDLENIIGMFVNTLPMRNFPEGSKSFEEFLLEVKENSLKAYENQDYQLDELIHKLNIQRDVSRNPLFDVIFTMQNMEQLNISVEGLTFEEIQQEHNISKFDLNFTAIEAERIICMELQYCTKLFNENTITNVIKYLVNIIRTVVQDKYIKLSKINILSDEEKKKLLIDFNNTKVDGNINKTVHELFEEQVKIRRDNIAVIFDNATLTYNELNEKSNQVAAMLVEKGVGPDIVIGVMVERSLEMLISIMGILKAGGAYLPIDPDYPEERVKYLLDNSATSILLSNADLRKKIKIEDKEVIVVDDFLLNCKYSVENLELSYPPDRLMYVLYTSGSTGNPKGVMVKCNSFVNLLNWFTQEFNINIEDNILLIAPAGFDLAQKNLYASLIKGGKLCLYNAGIYDYNLMSNVIEKEKITLINCTPSAFQPLIDLNKDSDYIRLSSLRYVYLGGEPINLKKLESWLYSDNCNGKIVNTYGPTECTDIATSYIIEHKQDLKLNSVPIGKPIYNTEVYVLDKYRSLLPIGAIGELYIGGIGVSRGYYNNIELTKQKFVYCNEISSSMLYKTGDLVKLLSDGNVEFLGRMDNQVKIRGFRIELGEIEVKLVMHESISEAIVIDRINKQGFQYLCAYIVCSEGLEVSSLKEYLREHLPGYMVPAFFVKMDKLPLTPNGKIDRKALPEVSGNDISGLKYEKARNVIEEKIIKIWSEVLEVEKVGINDDFFELGGDSLKVIKLISLLERQDIKLSVSDIFKYQNIKNIYDNIVVHNKIEKEKINNISDFEVELNKHFNFELKLKLFNIKNENFIVLFLCDNNWDKKDKVLEFINKFVSKKLLPHYVSKVSKYKEELSSVKYLEEFYEVVGIVTDTEGKLYQNLKELIQEQMIYFEQILLNSREIKKYSLSAIQQVTRQSNITLSGTSITFNDYMDYGILEKSILKLIERYGLLRSTIVKNSNDFNIKELAPPEGIKIPSIDISHYDFLLKDKVINELTEEYYQENFAIGNNITDKLLYKILLIKLNERDFRLYLPFNHIIFDGMSGDIIKQNLTDLYKNNGVEVFDRPEELDYESYIDQINQGPQGIDEKSIVEKYNLDKYSSSMYKFLNLEKSNLDKLYRRKEFIFTITNDIKDKFLENSWEISFLLFLELLKLNFGIETMPIRVLYYGRQYMEKKYYNTLGEFIDAVPILIDEEKYDTISLMDVTEKIRLAEKHNINFANLVYNKELSSKYIDLSKKLGNHNYLDVYSPIFNFVGKMNEYHRLSVNDTHEFNNKSNDINLGGFMVNVIINENFLILDAFSKVYEDEIIYNHLENFYIDFVESYLKNNILKE